MNILHVSSSPRGEASISRKLGSAIIEKIKAAHPDSTITERDLVKEPFPHLEEVHIQSFFTPAEARTAEHWAAIKHSDEVIAEIQTADIIVLEAPMYNFAIHSTLKAYFDHLVRSGLTFRYGENGVEGLVTGKKVYLVLSSGFIYSEGAFKEYDFVTPYVKTILGFIGLTDITVVRAEGTSLPDTKDMALQKALDSLTT